MIDRSQFRLSHIVEKLPSTVAESTGSVNDLMILYLDYSIENLKNLVSFMFKVSEVYIRSGVNTQKNQPQIPK